MSDKSGNGLERLANLGLIVVSLLASATLVRELQRDQSFLPSPTQAQAQARARPRSPALPVPGTPVSMPGIDWSGQEQTLVLVLSTTCRYCTNSAEFYKRVIEESERHRRTRLVAVFSQSQDEALTYLTRLGLTFGTVLQAPPSALGLNGTPTLLLVDKQGKVVRGWNGQLPQAREAEVIGAL
jgi:hypothetical protein